jgi:hypothetical protein
MEAEGHTHSAIVIPSDRRESRNPWEPQPSPTLPNGYCASVSKGFASFSSNFARYASRFSR